jgi:hypothetical protein
MPRRVLLAALLTFGMLLGMAALLPGPTMRAQDIPFATNTPRALATNTLRPPAPALVTPDAPLENYALRFWSEEALVATLAQAAQALTAGDPEAAVALRLTQYELEYRFPGAPSNADARAQLLNVLLAAPLGSVDMRAIARPYLETILQQNAPSFDTAGMLEQQGWRLEWTPANVDNRAPEDALLHSVYMLGDEVRYEDYVFASNPTPGRYNLFAGDYPAAPLAQVRSVRLHDLRDLTGDRGTEAAILLENDDGSQQIAILGWRSEGVVNLIAPGQPALFSEILDWQPDERRFSLSVARVDAPRWGCLSEGAADWSYVSNYYRASDAGIAFAQQPSLACTLADAEPLFAKPLDEAISTLENLYAVAEGDPAAPRAQLALAVLYALDGQLEPASSLAAALDDPALEMQASALQNALARGDTPAQICAAVVRAARTPETALCDVGAFLSRLFSETPLSRAEPIREQLAALGIAVREQITLQQVGRFDREAVSFELAGLRWWAFAPLSPETYTAEAIDPPGGSQPSSNSARALRPAARAVEALLSGDLSAALVALDNAVRARPDAPLSPEFVYVRALTRELAGDRVGSRMDYYAIARDFPASIWGVLAAAHLERR